LPMYRSSSSLVYGISAFEIELATNRTWSL